MTRMPSFHLLHFITHLIFTPLDRKPATSAKVIPRLSASCRKNRSDGDHHSSRLCCVGVIPDTGSCTCSHYEEIERPYQVSASFLLRARENLVSWRGSRMRQNDCPKWGRFADACRQRRLGRRLNSTRLRVWGVAEKKPRPRPGLRCRLPEGKRRQPNPEIGTPARLAAWRGVKTPRPAGPCAQ